MKPLTSNDLIAICEAYWQRTGPYERYVSACNELRNRGPLLRGWCRGLLNHPDYDARELGASLLGELGARGHLGDVKDLVVAELGALCVRPVLEDGKELQANSVAVSALAKIGGPAAVRELSKAVSTDADLSDVLWGAAKALGKLVGQPFEESPGGVEAARAWLRASGSGSRSPGRP